MTGPVASPGPGAESADAAPRVVLTVRLHGRTHGLLIEEFEPLGRRRRAARAAQLMLLGLVYERAHLRLGTTPTEGVAPAPRRAEGGADFGLAAEADAFVSAILRGPASSAKDDDPPSAIPTAARVRILRQGSG
jgi:hypothetical protein